MKDGIGWICSTHGEERKCVKPVEGLEETDHLRDLGLGGRIILTFILEKYDVNVWTGFN
jgi:hypothetical protein